MSSSVSTTTTGSPASAASNAASTGVDVNAIVSGLMTIERQPITALQTKVSADQAQISVLGNIQSLIANFQIAAQGLGNSSSSSLLANAATSSDTTAVTASADSTAVAGTYALNVTTLAQATKLVSAGQASNTSAISAGASTVTFTVGTISTDVSIAAGASLQDISTAINNANVGVTASIVNDGSATPYRLTLTSNSTGISNAINNVTVKSGGDAAINDLLAYNPTENAPAPVVPMAQTVAALNADFTVNGLRIIKASNTVTDAIQGVSFTLSKQATPVTLTVAHDSTAVTAKATSFVQAYNSLYSALKTSTAYKTNQPLQGDATLRALQTQMRSIAGSSVSGGTLANLFQAGISFDATGAMTLDSAKLNSALSTNFSDVANLFNSSTGYATKFDAFAASALGPVGTIATRTSGINQKITGLNKQIDTLNTRMTGIEKNYRTIYSSLNVMLIQMSQTSQYLTRQLG